MRGWRRFFHCYQNVLALLILGAFVLMLAFAPWIAPPADPAHPGIYKTVEGFRRGDLAQPPGPGLPFGTTDQGYDIFYTFVWGTRAAFRFGFMTALITAAIGILIGAISGYSGKLLHALLMRLTDAFIAFPPIAAVALIERLMTASFVYGSSSSPNWTTILLQLGFTPIMITLILFSWMPYARILETSISQLKHSGYVAAARSLGATDSRILFRHILPNAIAPVIVLTARDIGSVVILESAFTFAGFAGGSAWGTILSQGRDYIIGVNGNPFAFWWVFVPITLAIILFGMGWNLLGDGLNIVLDPHSTIRAGKGVLVDDGAVGEQVDKLVAGQVVGVVAGVYIGRPGGELEKGTGPTDVKDTVADGLHGLVDVAVKDSTQAADRRP